MVEHLWRGGYSDNVDVQPYWSAALDHRSVDVDMHALDDDWAPRLPRRLQQAGRDRQIRVKGLRARLRLQARARLVRLDAARGVERGAQQLASLPPGRVGRSRPRRAQPRPPARHPAAAGRQVPCRRRPRRHVEVVLLCAQHVQAAQDRADAQGWHRRERGGRTHALHAADCPSTSRRAKSTRRALSTSCDA